MNKIFSRLFVAACALPLFGCMVGPDFEKPEAEFLPEKWNTDVSGKNLTDGGESNRLTQEDLAQWWKVFGDETLTSLIDRALEANLDIMSARTKIAQSRANLGITQSGFFPTLDLNGSFSEGGKLNVSSGPSYGAGATAGWEIDIFGGTRRSIEASVASYRAALADKCATQISVAAEVADTYFKYRTLQQEIIITRSNLETQTKTYEVTLTRSKAGLAANLDAVRGAAQVQSTMAQIPSLEADLETTRHSLELLLGLPTGALKEELAEPKDLPELENFIPLGVPAELVRRRPDVMVAEYQYHSAFAGIGHAEADFYPKFNITGNISYQAPKIGDMFEKQYGTWSAGPSVSWNIFQAGKTVYNVELQEAVAEAAGIDWKSTVLTALKEVEDALITAAKERERIAYINLVVENNKKAYQYSFNYYKEGGLEFIDLLDAQRSMLSAEQSQIQSRQLFISHIISLYKALGGGWSLEDMKDDESKTRWLFFLSDGENRADNNNGEG